MRGMVAESISDDARVAAEMIATIQVRTLLGRIAIDLSGISKKGAGWSLTAGPVASNELSDGCAR